MKGTYLPIPVDPMPPGELEAMRQLVIRRERISVAHPEIWFSTHRGPDGVILHDISEPGRAEWAVTTADLGAALDDLEARYGR